MIPTASSSPITLLNPAVPNGKSALAADAQAPADAGLSGFELLLEAVQQLPQGLPVAAVETKAEPKKAENGDAPSGNELPQAGTLLPVAPLSPLPIASDHGGPDTAASSADTKAHDHDSDDKGKSVELVLSLVPANVAQPLAAPASPPEVAAVQSGAAPVALLDGADGGAVAVASTNGKATRSSGVTLTPALPTGKPEGGDTAVLAVASETAGASAAVDVPGERSVAGKSPADSDFDALVKHFEAPSSPQPAAPAVPAVAGDSASVNQASRTYANAASTASVPVPVGSNGWGDAVADKVMWFSANKVTSAEIHLNPPDLGPLQVRVSTQHDQASVVFTSQHAAVRDALDQALPRLREMMGNQGMHLLDVSVGGQSPQQQQSQQHFARSDAQNSGAGVAGLFADDSSDATTASTTPVQVARLLRAGVDAYA